MRFLAAATAALLLAAAPIQAQVTLDFEGDVGSVFGFVTQHKGFTFSGSSGDASWVHSSVFSNVTPTSGSFLAWSNGGAELTFSQGSTFDFLSAWLTGRNGSCSNQSSTLQTVRGFKNGVEQTSTTLNLDCTGQLAQYSFGFTDVDLVRFDVGDQGPVNLVLDDLVVSSQVPEPAGLLLVFTGLAGLGVVSRRRREES